MELLHQALVENLEISYKNNKVFDLTEFIMNKLAQLDAATLRHQPS